MPGSEPDDGAAGLIPRDPVTRFGAIMLLLTCVSLWGVRAPTIYTGALPFIGKNLPLTPNVVYLVFFGPPLSALAAGYLWFHVAGLKRRTTPPSPADRRDSIMLAVVFGALWVTTALLAAQYFLVIAPEDLCGSRPHLDFLWTNVVAGTRAVHCMSGTTTINQSSPYYWPPQIVQSWTEVLLPVAEAVFLFQAWKVRRSRVAA